jgi:hypothetical protein
MRESQSMPSTAIARTSSASISFLKAGFRVVLQF